MNAVVVLRGRAIDRALDAVLTGNAEVNLRHLVDRLANEIRPAPTARRIASLLLDRGWRRQVRPGGRRVFVRPEEPSLAQADGEPTNLRRQGLRLEAAASTVNGLTGRSGSDGFDVAVESFGLERDAFRAMLHARTGIPAEQLEHWLSL